MWFRIRFRLKIWRNEMGNFKFLLIVFKKIKLRFQSKMKKYSTNIESFSFVWTSNKYMLILYYSSRFLEDKKPQWNPPISLFSTLNSKWEYLENGIGIISSLKVYEEKKYEEKLFLILLFLYIFLLLHCHVTG